MRTRYIIRTKVLQVEERRDRTNYRTVEGKWVNDSPSLGWFVLFENSRELMRLGDGKPDLVKGQGVTITITGDEDESHGIPAGTEQSKD